MRSRSFAPHAMRALLMSAVAGCLVPVGCAAGFGRAPAVAPPRALPEPLPAAGPAALVQTPRHSFYIDLYEMSEHGADDFFAVPGQPPVLGLAPSHAGSICRRYGKRLCTVEEWRHACLGVQGRRFSYANAFQTGRCNTGDQKVGPTGGMPGCHSDAGVHDLIGNAMEWAAEEADGRAVALGGSFSSGPGSDCFSTQYFPQATRSDQVGFRCCRNATAPDATPTAPRGGTR